MSRPGGKSFLLQAAFAPSTRKKYLSAVDSFLSFSRECGEDPTEVSGFDDLLNDYIHHLYMSEAGKSSAHDTVYGVLMLLPELKGRLHTSMLALRGWSRLHPVLSYPPLTWDLTVIIAVKMALRGYSRLALGTILAFDSFLRIGELMGIRREDVADGNDPRIGVELKGMAIRLRKTKTGPNQWVEVENAQVMQLLRGLLATTRSGAHLFPGTTASYRRLFKTVCAELGLSNSYVPHSLRHGGATRKHLQGASIEDILHRGRWASTRTARRYVQSGRAVLLAMHVPPRVAREASILARDLTRTFTLTQEHIVGVGTINLR